MANLINFDFNNNPVRVVSKDPLNPLFVAYDVATALGYEKPRNAIKRFCKGALKQGGVQTKGGKQRLTVIGEPDLYRLIFGSKLKTAQQFQDWVFEEVLPAIRKTGKYEITSEPPSLTKAQAGHIYQTVMTICAKRGLSYQKVFGELKREFQASNYKDIPSKCYGEACQFLGVHPIEGELMPRGELEGPKQGKTITAKDEHHIASLCYYMANISQEWGEIARALKSLESPLATRMNGWVIDGKQFAKIVQYNVRPRFYEPMH